jgi:UDP-2-acetamido-2,6-beta-L-arabino-hexul-4-ose reductase
MILGSGLIGNSLSNYFFESGRRHEDFLFFCSGVSNSSCINFSEFEREEKLLLSAIKKNRFKKIIYFSTCAIYLGDRNVTHKSKYIEHKIKMERLVFSRSNSYLILRLPNLIGKTKNQFTLVNFFYYNILNNIHFELWKNAKRNFLDIRDLLEFIDILLLMNITNQILPLVSEFNTSVSYVVEVLEEILGKRASVTEVNKCSDENFSLQYSLLIDVISLKKNTLPVNESLLYHYKPGEHNEIQI